MDFPDGWRAIVPDIAQWQMSNSAAENYEKIPVRYILGPWAHGLVEASGLQGDERVLDLACGTGVVTRAAAARLGPTGHITGLDLNEGMLDVAKTIAVSGSGRVDWARGSALEIDEADATFDLVLCQQGLQFFPDKAKAVSETYRVLNAGGRICFSVWAGAGPYNEAVAAAISEHIDDATAQQYLTTRKVPDADTLQSLFLNAGFKDIQVKREEKRIRLPDIENFVLAHLLGTPISEALAALPESRLSALARSTVERVAVYADGQDVVVPDSIHLILATKQSLA
jgi:ubiquinone/menaquinone biosynthesis C-methylase UbiE